MVANRFTDPAGWMIEVAGVRYEVSLIIERIRDNFKLEKGRLAKKRYTEHQIKKGLFQL